MGTSLIKVWVQYFFNLVINLEIGLAWDIVWDSFREGYGSYIMSENVLRVWCTLGKS